MSEKKLKISAKKYNGDTAVISARLPNDLIKKFVKYVKKREETEMKLCSCA